LDLSPKQHYSKRNFASKVRQVSDSHHLPETPCLRHVAVLTSRMLFSWQGLRCSDESFPRAAPFVNWATYSTCEVSQPAAVR
jgi:hypothetical protein